MKPLVLTLAAIAGFACGALWPRAGFRDSDPAPADATDGVGKREASDGAIGASDPREEALGAALRELLGTKSDLRGLASLGAALDRLDARGVAKLLELLDNDPSRPRDDRLGWLFGWWMKRDPAAATAWVQPRLDAAAQDGTPGPLFESRSRGRLILAWAQAAPEAALDYARRHAQSGLATALLEKVRSEWKTRDDPALLALLRDFPAGKARNAALEAFHTSWASRDPAAALASVQALAPGMARARASSSVLLAWAGRDPAAAFAQYRALGLSDPGLLSQVLTYSVRKNPAETLGWLQQLDPAQMARCAPKIVETWAQRDPVAALEWAVANGVRLSPRSEWTSRLDHDGFSRTETSTSSGFFSPLGKAFAEQPEATLAWLRALPPGAERNRVTELAVTVCRTREQALSLFETLAPAAAARAAGSMALQFQEDPERGRAWAESLPDGPVRAQAWAGLGALPGQLPELPPGPDRDALLSGTLHRIGAVPPPAEKLATMLEIGDPVLRRDMFEEVMEYYSTSPHQAEDTRAALEQAAVPEEWKQRWRTALGSGK